MKTTLYHVTPRINVCTILQHGLLTDLANGQIRGVWLCDAVRLPWAVAHIGKHHGVRVNDLSILTVDASDITLRRIRSGVFVSKADIEMTRIGEVIYFALGEPS